jgi:demethylmenaquinone methyltransferase / 2-methoxy-6-polyprenyl-1,4-benzoquinol methylase
VSNTEPPERAVPASPKSAATVVAPSSDHGVDPERVSGAGLPVGREKTVMVRSMFDAIAPRYDLVNRMMTFGLDVRWRRRAVRALGLPAGSRVLDLACGTGDFLTIADRSGLRPFGIDLSWGMLVADHSGRPRAQADGSRLPVATASVDGVTCGYALRNFTELDSVL